MTRDVDEDWALQSYGVGEVIVHHKGEKDEKIEI